MGDGIFYISSLYNLNLLSQSESPELFTLIQEIRKDTGMKERILAYARELGKKKV